MKTPKVKKRSKRIPDFKSQAEEAEFWGTHDSMDYLEDTEEVKDIVFIRPEIPVLKVRPALWKELLREARKRHTTLDQLVNRWLKEKLSKAG